MFVLFSSLVLIWLFGRFFFEQLHAIFQMCYGEGLVTVARGSSDWMAAGRFAVEKAFFMTAPIMGILFLISVASTTLQTGFLYNEEALQFRPDRLDPIQGFFRIFSLRALIEGLKALAKLGVIMFLAYWLLKDQLIVLPSLIHFSVGQIFMYLGTLLTRLLFGVGLFMTALAAVDYLFQRWELEREMRMTKQEVREELKSREGDPLVKARMKRVQREIATRRMMEEVPKADVVVTNPTHIAVALKYDDTMVAPKLIAKGRT